MQVSAVYMHEGMANMSYTKVRNERLLGRGADIIRHNAYKYS